jgi:HSP20 family molecular chaperone IbpA
MSLLNTILPSLNQSPARSGSREAGPTVKPRYEINETDEAYDLTVQLPGVARDGLELTVEAGEFRVVGRRAWKQPEDWTALYREASSAPYELVLTHDNAIDPDQISATLKDGVLTVSLPKAAALKPRKIAVS